MLLWRWSLLCKNIRILNSSWTISVLTYKTCFKEQNTENTGVQISMNTMNWVSIHFVIFWKCYLLLVESHSSDNSMLPYIHVLFPSIFAIIYLIYNNNYGTVEPQDVFQIYQYLKNSSLFTNAANSCNFLDERCHVRD